MSIKNAYQTITTIPDGNYQGYYWWSDETKPKVLDDEPIAFKYKEAIIQIKDNQLPFMVEGNFYDATQNISIQIKNIDGKHHISKIDLNNLPKEAYKKQQYMAHDIEGYEQFEVIQAWELVEDPLLENMETYQPAWTAFVGFVKSI